MSNLKAVPHLGASQPVFHLLPVHPKTLHHADQLTKALSTVPGLASRNADGPLASSIQGDSSSTSDRQSSEMPGDCKARRVREPCRRRRRGAGAPVVAHIDPQAARLGLAVT